MAIEQTITYTCDSCKKVSDSTDETPIAYGASIISPSIPDGWVQVHGGRMNGLYCQACEPVHQKYYRYAEVLGCFKPRGVYHMATGEKPGWSLHAGCNAIDNCGICGPMPECLEDPRKHEIVDLKRDEHGVLVLAECSRCLERFEQQPSLIDKAGEV